MTQAQPLPEKDHAILMKIAKIIDQQLSKGYGRDGLPFVLVVQLPNGNASPVGNVGSVGASLALLGQLVDGLRADGVKPEYGDEH